jgi:hypothetical protein
MTDRAKDREAAAESRPSARHWRHLSSLQGDAALPERGGYAALHVAVQRVAAREAGLTQPERQARGWR